MSDQERFFSVHGRVCNLKANSSSQTGDSDSFHLLLAMDVSDMMTQAQEQFSLNLRKPVLVCWC